MRLQLVVVALLVVEHAHSPTATLSVRGVYYKERSTRVMQPMLDGMFEVGARGLLDRAPAGRCDHVGIGALRRRRRRSRSPSSATKAAPATRRNSTAPPARSSIASASAATASSPTRATTDRSMSARAAKRISRRRTRRSASAAASRVDKVDASGSQGPLGGIALLCKGDALGDEHVVPARRLQRVRQGLADHRQGHRRRRELRDRVPRRLPVEPVPPGAGAGARHVRPRAPPVRRAPARPPPRACATSSRSRRRRSSPRIASTGTTGTSTRTRRRSGSIQEVGLHADASFMLPLLPADSGILLQAVLSGPDDAVEAVL